jgi:hypothetical protein
LGRILSSQEINKQSKKAYKRWESIWHKNAKENRKHYSPLENVRDTKTGKNAIIFAFGPSFIQNMADFKRNDMQYDYDVICVDKAIKSCIKAGIKPNYCLVADAQVDFEQYGRIDPKHVKRITLIVTVTANSDWVDYWVKNKGNVIFIINKDGIRTHKIFNKYFDYQKDEAYLVPAASNVANSALVFASLVLGYDKILLAAFNYCYEMGGDYYGDKSKPVDTNYGFKKHAFNNHRTLVSPIDNKLVQASYNMHFSAGWLVDFVGQLEKENKCNIINVTGAGILSIKKQARFKAA